MECDLSFSLVMSRQSAEFKGEGTVQELQKTHYCAKLLAGTLLMLRSAIRHWKRSFFAIPLFKPRSNSLIAGFLCDCGPTLPEKAAFPGLGRNPLASRNLELLFPLYTIEPVMYGTCV